MYFLFWSFPLNLLILVDDINKLHRENWYCKRLKAEKNAQIFSKSINCCIWPEHMISPNTYSSLSMCNQSAVKCVAIDICIEIFVESHHSASTLNLFNVVSIPTCGGIPKCNANYIRCGITYYNNRLNLVFESWSIIDANAWVTKTIDSIQYQAVHHPGLWKWCMENAWWIQWNCLENSKNLEIKKGDIDKSIRFGLKAFVGRSYNDLAVVNYLNWSLSKESVSY